MPHNVGDTDKYERDKLKCLRSVINIMIPLVLFITSKNSKNHADRI